MKFNNIYHFYKVGIPYYYSSYFHKGNLLWIIKNLIKSFFVLVFRIFSINTIYFIQKIIKKPNRFTIPFLLLMLAIFYFSLIKNSIEKYVTLDDIVKAGEISFVTRKGSSCYYIYEGHEMGFEYDLAKEFADYLGVKLKIKVVGNKEKFIPFLFNGKGAFIGANLSRTPKQEKKVSFSDGYLTVQKKIISNMDNKKINKIHELNNQTIHIKKGTAHQEYLEDLKRQGININIKTIENTSIEKLIRRINKSDIHYTVVNSHIAYKNRWYYPKLSIGTLINEDENLAWAVHPKSVTLLYAINSFFKKIKKNGIYAEIYDKYYGGIEDFNYYNIRNFHRKIRTKMPEYIKYIKQAAAEQNFDWRLIAAQVYQESHFNKWAESSSKAYGLMQLLRSTAKIQGVDKSKIFNPKTNIEAGVRHLKFLFNLYDKATGNDRLFIALAAYNVGHGHVKDARNLAIKMNLAPNKWLSISKTLLLLQKKKYYKLAKYGYCRGIEPVNYVKRIRLYYDILRYKSIAAAT